MGRRLPLPPSLVALALRQEGLVSTRQCEAHGLHRGHRASAVRAGRAVRVQRTVYDLLPALTVGAGPAADAGPDGRRRRAAWAALLAAGPDAVAVGTSALALLGVEGLPPTLPGEVALPGASHRRPRPGVVVRCFDAGMPVVRVGGARVASPPWAVAQAVCELPRDRAVAVLDSALRGRLVVPDLGDVASVLRGRRGAAAARGWLRLADGRAQSPLETWARLQCRDAGLPPAEPQVAVRDARGRVVARGDLGWWRRDGRLLVVEIDGRGPHREPDALYTDRERQNAIVATGGVDLLRFTARDVLAGVVAPTVRRHLTEEPSRRPRDRAAAAAQIGARSRGHRAGGPSAVAHEAGR
ncbi:type IV toxin-antitoxin system AbiEi family antitoxin domain-containing protein [Cellulomonas sp. JZ18]|uniref:type IV toxin-antitoxin system AbiEi family antitoxin domain-containing protein n=1 Tax=Cellulomonas sp. JZ18 TaxID=2654191 RepID=UPI0018AFA19E|nr:type IV toxin-antitoxin system AbiEi family antitoxin domain-containing protein [Cellulomonas sp. JZ18]